MTPRILGPLLLLVSALSLSGCDGWQDTPPRAVPDLPGIHTRLSFSCVHEQAHIPLRDPEADQLYVHARWLGKNNLLKEDPLVYRQMERLLRIATAYGHDQANLELRQMLGLGKAISEDVVKETLDLTQSLIDRGIPGGYYDMGRYLEHGYGVQQDGELALKYYRKSADLGSPEGQYKVGEMLAPIDVAPDIAVQMWRCAAEQGHGEAGLMLGVYLKDSVRRGDHSANASHDAALQALQLGAKAGHFSAAGWLKKGFDGPPASDEMFYLGQAKDPERVSRYAAINSFLFRYDYLGPKVPEIDEIVPLPPARLPKWDGSFQWLKAHEANVPPPLPSEARMEAMARAKGLDLETGRLLQRTYIR